MGLLLNVSAHTPALPRCPRLFFISNWHGGPRLLTSLRVYRGQRFLLGWKLGNAHPGAEASCCPGPATLTSAVSSSQLPHCPSFSWLVRLLPTTVSHGCSLSLTVAPEQFWCLRRCCGSSLSALTRLSPVPPPCVRDSATSILCQDLRSPGVRPCPPEYSHPTAF